MSRGGARSGEAAVEYGWVRLCPFRMRNLSLRHPFGVHLVVRSAQSLTEFWVLGCPGRVTSTWHRGGRAAVAAGSETGEFGAFAHAHCSG